MTMSCWISQEPGSAIGDNSAYRVGLDGRTTRRISGRRFRRHVTYQRATLCHARHLKAMAITILTSFVDEWETPPSSNGTAPEFVVGTKNGFLWVVNNLQHNVQTITSIWLQTTP
jgi:hypothetical protein